MVGKAERFELGCASGAQPGAAPVCLGSRSIQARSQSLELTLRHSRPPALEIGEPAGAAAGSVVRHLHRAGKCRDPSLSPPTPGLPTSPSSPSRYWLRLLVSLLAALVAFLRTLPTPHIPFRRCYCIREAFGGRAAAGGAAGRLARHTREQLRASVPDWGSYAPQNATVPHTT